MDVVIAPAILGVFIVIVGVCNMRGHIASIHWYHRRNVSEQDVLPFGRKVGLGTIIIGVSLILWSALSYASKTTGNTLFASAGEVLMFAGLAAGLGLSLYAMFKYNKGIF